MPQSLPEHLIKQAQQCEAEIRKVLDKHKCFLNPVATISQGAVNMGVQVLPKLPESPVEQVDKPAA